MSTPAPSAAATADLTKSGGPQTNTSRLLMVVGDLVCSWLLLRQAAVASVALAAGPADKDLDFYAGKVAAAKFFAAYNLPKIGAERVIAENVDLDLMDIAESAF